MLLIGLETFLGGMPIRLIMNCDKLVYDVPFLGCVRFCVRYCTEGRGLAAPFFLWLADLARPVPVLDGLLARVVVDCILRRYLLCPAARDAMERLLVDAGHVLRSGQDCGCQEKNCEG